MNEPPGNQNPASAYNINELMTCFSATYQRLDNLTGAPKKRRERTEFGDIAAALCNFFTSLAKDEPFWTWLSCVAEPDRDQVREFLANLDGFEDRQQVIYQGLKLDTLSSVQLATGLTTAIEQFRPMLEGGKINLGQAVQDLAGYVARIQRAVCENPTWKNVSLGLSAFTIVGSLVGGLAAASSLVAAGSIASFVIPIVVAAGALAALAARIADDRTDRD